MAPVLEKCGVWPWCEVKRDVYLPEGEWVHLWTGEVFTGPVTREFEAPMQEPPVFYRMDDTEAVAAVKNLRDFDVGVHDE